MTNDHGRDVIGPLSYDLVRPDPRDQDDEGVLPMLTCPDCGRGTIPEGGACPACHLGWDDLVAAAAMLDAHERGETGADHTDDNEGS